MASCQNALGCGKDAVEAVTAAATAQLPQLTLGLCGDHAAQWKFVLAGKHRAFESVPLKKAA